MTDWPRYYTIIGDPPANDRYFRVSDVGRYDRWDPGTRTWVHVAAPAARDWYSRAIETGDGVIPTEPKRAAQLR